MAADDVKKEEAPKEEKNEEEKKEEKTEEKKEEAPAADADDAAKDTDKPAEDEHPNPRIEIPWHKMPDVDIYANPPSAKVLQMVELMQTLTLEETAEFIQTVQLLTGVDDVMLGRQPAEWEAFDGAHGGGVGEYTAPVGGGGGDAGGDADADAGAPEAQTAFSVKLTGFDAKSKIKVIKEIRSLTGAGLKEAKELVEAGDAIVKEGLSKDLADELVASIKAAGGECELV